MKIKKGQVVLLSFGYNENYQIDSVFISKEDFDLATIRNLFLETHQDIVHKIWRNNYLEDTDTGKFLKFLKKQNLLEELKTIDINEDDIISGFIG